ncbi:hypothetical protein [Chryseolinea lacunae]|uniref:DUF1049 domain-containing protein n=1 Tax=Chryseolinea lacunae TaxID=2801331 RepID=A0ABS1KNE7_9BACT|nr:hypothetical protein [Chryseolinea lacunae]MBL0740212.1 hypothetical protein [Chryseolinea lacunae]
MNKTRIIFYSVFAIFHIGAFIFTLLIQDFGFLTKIYNYIGLFKYITFFGILLIIADVVWSWRVNRDNEKEKGALTHELNMLKAKLFDLQETAKSSSAAKPAPKQ